MPPLIENPANCEIRSLICYFSAKGVKAVEIHRKMCGVLSKHNEWWNGTQMGFCIWRIILKVSAMTTAIDNGVTVATTSGGKFLLQKNKKTLLFDMISENYVEK